MVHGGPFKLQISTHVASLQDFFCSSLKFTGNSDLYACCIYFVFITAHIGFLATQISTHVASKLWILEDDAQNWQLRSLRMLHLTAIQTVITTICWQLRSLRMLHRQKCTNSEAFNSIKLLQFGS